MRLDQLAIIMHVLHSHPLRRSEDRRPPIAGGQNTGQCVVGAEAKDFMMSVAADLVGDIGATNGRFAVVGSDGTIGKTPGFFD